MIASTKVFGARIVCVVCGAQLFADPESGFRESFDLLRIDGEWRCELHRAEKQQRASRAVAAAPLEALAQFERLLEDESARFEAALVMDRSGFATFSRKIERGLAGLRKALAARQGRRL
jgi:hypothetical protein